MEESNSDLLNGMEDNTENLDDGDFLKEMMEYEAQRRKDDGETHCFLKDDQRPRALDTTGNVGSIIAPFPNLVPRADHVPSVLQVSTFPRDV